jgi:hypothetical protein
MMVQALTEVSEMQMVALRGCFVNGEVQASISVEEGVLGRMWYL